MSKQDRQGARTVSDLERKYDFEYITGKGDNSVAKLARQLNSLNQTLAQFMASTIGKIEELERSSAVWFYGGAPTLENQPFVSWETDDVRKKHVGDFYYDTETGSMYLFHITTDESGEEPVTVYEWLNIINVTPPEELPEEPTEEPT